MLHTHVPSTAINATTMAFKIISSLIFVPMYLNRCFPLLKLHL